MLWLETVGHWYILTLKSNLHATNIPQKTVCFHEIAEDTVNLILRANSQTKIVITIDISPTSNSLVLVTFQLTEDIYFFFLFGFCHTQ